MTAGATSPTYAKDIAAAQADVAAAVKQLTAAATSTSPTTTPGHGSGDVDDEPHGDHDDHHGATRLSPGAGTRVPDRRLVGPGGFVTICVVEIPGPVPPPPGTPGTRRTAHGRPGIDLGKYKLGWHDTESYVYTPKKGLNEEVVRDISYHKSEPEWMTKFRLNALKRFERKPMLEWFAKNMPDIDFDDIYYYLKPTEGQVSDWDMLPEEMKTTYEKLGIPEAERKFLAGVTAQYESEVVYHKNREDLERAGHPLHRHGHRAARVPGARAEVLRHGDPARRQQVRRAQLGGVVGWLVHLRAAGRARRHAAAGVLPHQRGERGPVRAHADHRRRGLVGALRRGLLGAGVLHRLAALRGGRAHRQARRAHPLHDDPELVAERLQPRHQAGAGRDRGDRRVDRRQPRLEAHDEVPGGRDDRPEGARRGAVGRVRGRRASTRTRAPR